MHYFTSTRNKENRVSASEAIIAGLAKDQGLYTPHLNQFEPFKMEELLNLNYQQLATRILSTVLDDYTEAEIRDCIDHAYDSKFSEKEIVSVREYANTTILGLYHGPTCAFKDMALTVLPHLLTKAYKKQKNDKTVYILTATSGDTGKAALEGFKDVENTYITVFFPDQNVSEIQRRQMITTGGKNTNVVRVNGNFDDCQRIVKSCFKNEKLMQSEKVQLCSANSINLGRLAPQIVYYFYAYIKLVNEKKITLGQKVNFSVPSGNFGDILAGYMAKKLGCPISKLICASNVNDVLCEFVRTGHYDRKRPFIGTISPSMDILVSSNVERLLYILSDYDSEKVKGYMQKLETEGEYQLDEEMTGKLTEDFISYAFDDQKTCEMISKLHQTSGHAMDTHTAIGVLAAEAFKEEKINDDPVVCLATASCYKFSKDVYKAITGETVENEFECMQKLEKITDEKIPAGLKNLLEMEVCHNQLIDKEEGIRTVLQKAGQL